MKKLVLCPPTSFDIQYEINPWMNTHNCVNHDLVQKQYESLKETYTKIGIPFFEITPDSELPDQVYTTDTGHAEHTLFIKSNFRYPERRKESDRTSEFLRQKGYTIHELPKNIYFEGQGDFVMNTNTYFLGYGKRSMKEAAPLLEHILKKPVIPIELTNPYFYHLDTCFGVLSHDIAMVYIPAFTPDGIKKIKDHFKTVIAVHEDDAREFCCNFTSFGKHIVVHSGISAKLKTILTSLGFELHLINVSEYIKGGGSIKCISLQLYD